MAAACCWWALTMLLHADPAPPPPPLPSLTENEWVARVAEKKVTNAETIAHLTQLLAAVPSRLPRAAMAATEFYRLFSAAFPSENTGCICCPRRNPRRSSWAFRRCGIR
jgi:hypothetical protein